MEASAKRDGRGRTGKRSTTTMMIHSSRQRRIRASLIGTQSCATGTVAYNVCSNTTVVLAAIKDQFSRDNNNGTSTILLYERVGVCATAVRCRRPVIALDRELSMMYTVTVFKHMLI